MAARITTAEAIGQRCHRSFAGPCAWGDRSTTCHWLSGDGELYGGRNVSTASRAAIAIVSWDRWTDGWWSSSREEGQSIFGAAGERPGPEAKRPYKAE